MCQLFVVELCKQIKERLPNNVDIMEKISLFSSENAQKPSKPDITNVAVHFRHICDDINGTIDEWNNLHYVKWNNISSPEMFWNEVRIAKDSGDQPKFPRISKLALILLALPFSNASVERAFSIFNVVKNKLRNKMNISTVEAILRVRYSLNNGCHNFIPSAKMINLFSAKTMYSDNEADSGILEAFDED